MHGNNLVIALYPTFSISKQIILNSIFYLFVFSFVFFLEPFHFLFIPAVAEVKEEAMKPKSRPKLQATQRRNSESNFQGAKKAMEAKLEANKQLEKVLFLLSSFRSNSPTPARYEFISLSFSPFSKEFSRSVRISLQTSLRSTSELTSLSCSPFHYFHLESAFLTSLPPLT